MSGKQSGPKLSIFNTNPIFLSKLLEECHSGELQLPDFQRSWVWDEDRIKSLIFSVSRAFPIGALMTLSTGGEVDFKYRPIENTPVEAKSTSPQALLLDGQQRMTALYQAIYSGNFVETITPKKKKVNRWFYIDIRKALDPATYREEMIESLPEDRILRGNFGRDVILDLTSSEKEYADLMYPVSQIFDYDWDKWQDGFDEYWSGEENKEKRIIFRKFKRSILDNFKMYQVPVIALGKETSREGVCVVFEKVNTGGKPLDAFELVTAMYAASGHELRKDWYGDPKTQTKGRKQLFVEAQKYPDLEKGIIGNVSSTDFLQAISLFHTRDLRRSALAEGKRGKDLPAVTGNRNALLNLPLDAYQNYEKQLEAGFLEAAKFLRRLNIFRIFDLPYQSQIIPLAAILAEIGNNSEHTSTRTKLEQWYWCGVFGELYGSAIDTRIAKDFMEVPEWINRGQTPTTVSEGIMHADRLKTMRMRLSAAYKGVNALLMNVGALDIRSGQKFNDTVFFGENVDIHHIFPKKWCKENGIDQTICDSIINKTPLSDRTNRILGGSAPSEYLAKLEKGNEETPPIAREKLDSYLRSHLINPDLLRANDFENFIVDRQQHLLHLIEHATGKSAYTGEYSDEGENLEEEEDTIESRLTITS